MASRIPFQIFSSGQKYYALAGAGYFTFFSIINVHKNTQKAIKKKENDRYENRAASDIARFDNFHALMFNAGTLLAWPVFFPLRIAYSVYNSYIDGEE